MSKRGKKGPFKIDDCLEEPGPCDRENQQGPGGQKKSHLRLVRSIINKGIGPLGKSFENKVLTDGSATRKRNHDCNNYNRCLNIAAALNWDDFTCSNCIGKIHPNLIWQARQARRSDQVAKRICPDGSISEKQPEAVSEG